MECTDTDSAHAQPALCTRGKGQSPVLPGEMMDAALNTPDISTKLQNQTGPCVCKETQGRE